MNGRAENTFHFQSIVRRVAQPVNMKVTVFLVVVALAYFTASADAACKDRDCSIDCIFKGYNTGSCVGGRCQCRRTYAAACKDRDCSIDCIFKGYNTGSCVGGRCQCRRTSG